VIEEPNKLPKNGWQKWQTTIETSLLIYLYSINFKEDYYT
jgi:hypothetical protein